LKGQIQEFSKFPISIGRQAGCQVRFEKDLTTISRHHARIERQGNRFRIIDASTNGTYVNGKRIADVYLRDGDVITFSDKGPKTNFLTKIKIGNIPAPAAPVDLPASAPTSSLRPHDPEPGHTAGPALEIPVISTHATLVIQFGQTLQSYNLLPVTIGSHPTCDFVITDDSLATHHVQIFFNENAYYVKDLTGKKMVSINGRPIGTQSVLAKGAELSLTEQGPRFRFIGGGRLAHIPNGLPVS
jgi:pSer/pThr/pTyr-binding forkhead associated (FHA) protein